MRIGIDLSPVYADKTGIGWYGFNLAKHLVGRPVGGHIYVLFAYGCIIGELKPFIKGSVELVEIREIKNSFLRPFLRILQMTINVSRYRFPDINFL